MCLSPFQTRTQQMYIQTQPHDICIFIIKWLFQRHPLNMDHALEGQYFGSHLPYFSFKALPKTKTQLPPEKYC